MWAYTRLAIGLHGPVRALNQCRPPFQPPPQAFAGIIFRRSQTVTPRLLLTLTDGPADVGCSNSHARTLLVGNRLPFLFYEFSHRTNLTALGSPASACTHPLAGCAQIRAAVSCPSSQLPPLFSRLRDAAQAITHRKRSQQR